MGKNGYMSVPQAGFPLSELSECMWWFLSDCLKAFPVGSEGDAALAQEGPRDQSVLHIHGRQGTGSSKCHQWNPGFL